MADPWFFEDVVHNSDDAETGRSGLAYAAASLSEALRIVEEDIPVIVEDWAGEARSVFDTEMPGILEAGHQLVAMLLGGSMAVAYHDELASNEQTLRAYLRTQWEQDEREAG